MILIDDINKEIRADVEEGILIKDYWLDSHYVPSDETAAWPKNWFFMRKEKKNDKRKIVKKVEKRSTGSKRS